MSRYDAIPDALVTADLGEGVGVQPVVDWSVTRQMSGGGLPGQARGATGSSVGTGSVTVHSPAGRSPWTTGPIRPGGPITLTARADAADPMTTAAAMTVRSVTGTATSPALSLAVEDDLGGLRDPVRIPAVIPPAGTTVDASTIITQIATAAGVASLDVDTADSPIATVLLEPGRTAWETLQEIARCTLGWVGVTPDGTLTYVGHEAIVSGPITETIVAEESLEDIPWSISSDDVADRVEVTYQPPVVRRSPAADLDVWASTETLFLGPGTTHYLTIDIDGAADELAGWCSAWWTAYPEGQWSRWTAYDEATAAPAPDSALAVGSVLLSPSRAQIALTNRSAGVLVVTELLMRARVRVTRGETLTLASGAPAEVARSTLTVDLGSWVQDVDRAREILLWLAGATTEPLPTLTRVRVIPDMSRRVGQIVKVADRTTNLTAKALISGVHLSGADGALTQHLDLTVLWVAEADVARRWTALGLTSEGDVATHLTNILGAGATEADAAAWLPIGVI